MFVGVGQQLVEVTEAVDEVGDPDFARHQQQLECDLELQLLLFFHVVFDDVVVSLLLFFFLVEQRWGQQDLVKLSQEVVVHLRSQQVPLLKHRGELFHPQLGDYHLQLLCCSDLRCEKGVPTHVGQKHKLVNLFNLLLILTLGLDVLHQVDVNFCVEAGAPVLPCVELLVLARVQFVAF